MTQKPAALDSLSFEQALEELEGIVSSLENGQLPLEDAITGYTRGSKLKDHCEKKLKQARLKVEKIQADQSGNTTAEPFDS